MPYSLTISSLAFRPISISVFCEMNFTWWRLVTKFFAHAERLPTRRARTERKRKDLRERVLIFECNFDPAQAGGHKIVKPCHKRIDQCSQYTIQNRRQNKSHAAF